MEMWHRLSLRYLFCSSEHLCYCCTPQPVPDAITAASSRIFLDLFILIFGNKETSMFKNLEKCDHFCRGLKSDVVEVWIMSSHGRLPGNEWRDQCRPSPLCFLQIKSLLSWWNSDTPTSSRWVEFDHWLDFSHSKHRESMCKAHASAEQTPLPSWSRLTSSDFSISLK